MFLHFCRPCGFHSLTDSCPILISVYFPGNVFSETLLLENTCKLPIIEPDEPNLEGYVEHHRLFTNIFFVPFLHFDLAYRLSPQGRRI